MSSLYIIVAADVFIALFIFISIIQVARRKVRVGCWSNIYLAFAGLLLIAGVIVNELTDEPDPLTTPLAMGSVAVLVITGLIFTFLDQRRDDYQPLYSRGILSAGVGLLLLISTVLVPVIPTSIFPIPTPTLISDGIKVALEDSNIVPTEVVIITEESQFIPASTAERTPQPEPSPTRTRRAYIPPTITPTPIAPAVADACGATVTTNLNVRSEPSTDGEIVGVISEGTYIGLTARNADGTWWQTELAVQNETGWLSAEFLELDTICTQ